MMEFIPALSGGMIIGLAASLMILVVGRISGISGIAFGALNDWKPWALLFLLGLITGAASFHLISGVPIPRLEVDNQRLIAGGLLVGIGTKIGAGCTSGHGICGLARLSKRSLVATTVFISFGIFTVYATQHGGSL